MKVLPLLNLICIQLFCFHLQILKLFFLPLLLMCSFITKNLICEPNIAKKALQYMICDFRDFLLFWLFGHFSFYYEMHTRIPKGYFLLLLVFYYICFSTFYTNRLLWIMLLSRNKKITSCQNIFKYLGSTL